MVREVVHFHRLERAGADLQVERRERRAPLFDALQQHRRKVQTRGRRRDAASCSAYTVW